MHISCTIETIELKTERLIIYFCVNYNFHINIQYFIYKKNRHIYVVIVKHTFRNYTSAMKVLCILY